MLGKLLLCYMDPDPCQSVSCLADSESLEARRKLFEFVEGVPNDLVMAWKDKKLMLTEGSTELNCN